MEFIQRIAALESLLANLVRVGVISSVSAGSETATVTFADRDDVVSYDLPILVRNTSKNKDYWCPDVGEPVLCLFLPSGIEAGFILGGYYPEPVARPESNPDKRVTEYSDGTRVEYDRAAHKMLVDLGATKFEATRENLKLESNGTTLELNAGGLTVNGQTISLQGAGSSIVTGANAMSAITGGLGVTGGDVTADNISLKGHTHNETGSVTNPPNPT